MIVFPGRDTPEEMRNGLSNPLKVVQSEGVYCSISRNPLLSLVPPHLPFHQLVFQAQTLLKVSYRAGESVYAMQL